MRVVLYAEGSRETTPANFPTNFFFELPPGTPLEEDWLGPSHLLVRRCIALQRKLPEQAIRFEAPLRTRRGHLATGSHLLREDILQQILTWFSKEQRPDLAVVLIDSDGQQGRKQQLAGYTRRITTPLVIGVAQNEFEAWLLADGAALSQVLPGAATVGAPQSLLPGQAKARLESLCVQKNKELKETSLSIAAACDLSTVARVCPSFSDFLQDILALPR